MGLTDVQAVTNINGYSKKQLGYHNSICDSKVHSIVHGVMSQVETDMVNATVSHIDGLTQAEIDTNINSILNDSGKLSSRPC